MEIFDRFT